MEKITLLELVCYPSVKAPFSQVQVEIYIKLAITDGFARLLRFNKVSFLFPVDFRDKNVLCPFSSLTQSLYSG